MQNSDIRFTVIVTAHNEERHILQTIRALSNQRGLENGMLEILLVDDGSSDATVAEAAASGSEILTILHNEHAPEPTLTSRQRALDLGFRRARGDIILTLDADGRPPEDWVQKMAQPVLDGHADAVAGPVGFVPHSGWISAWQSCDVSYYLLVSTSVSRIGISGGILFGNFCFKSSLYRDIGGFDALGMALTEDLQFGMAIQAMGAKIAYVRKDCLVEFEPCKNFRELVARTMRVSSGRYSVLAAILTLVPVSLLLALVTAIVIGGPIAWAIVAVRYFLGVALVAVAVWKLGRRSNWPTALIYEPLVFVIAPTVLVRVLSGTPVAWGQNTYAR